MYGLRQIRVIKRGLRYLLRERMAPRCNEPILILRILKDKPWSEV